jgi:broad specificity phosphatase PhoE
MRITIARHAQTVYNAGLRMQGRMAHTPLTRTGIAQAEAMGRALAADPLMSAGYDIWSSPSGRTIQTAAIIAEHLGHDFFRIRTDPRLLEIDVGTWEGRSISDVVAELGPIMCPERGIFATRPPGGEWYPAIADRLKGWLADLDPDRDILGSATA